MPELSRSLAAPGVPTYQHAYQQRSSSGLSVHVLASYPRPLTGEPGHVDAAMHTGIPVPYHSTHQLVGQPLWSDCVL